jgi:hypothetical protein
MRARKLEKELIQITEKIREQQARIKGHVQIQMMIRI